MLVRDTRRASTRTPGVLLGVLCLLALASRVVGDVAPCRVAPKPNVSGPLSLRRQDSDGIVRTAGSNCQAADGLNCDLCCNGRCCEDFSGTSAAALDEQHWVPLRFAVISRGRETYDRLTGEGKIDENLRALNRQFTAIGMWFYSAAVTYYNDTRMVDSCNTDPCYVSTNCDFYTYTIPRVKGDNSREALVILCDEITYLGEAQFPWASVEDSEYQYLQAHAKTVGINGPAWPTGLGHTLVHEMGHYFGLFHVFESPGRCNSVGDWVADTNAASSAASRTLACDASHDTCSEQPGLDPINNFMNYARDECMTEFTPGQRDRMRQGFRRYRPLLMRNTRVPNGVCTSNSSKLDECTCTNGGSPNDRCVVATTSAPPTAPATDDPTLGTSVPSSPPANTTTLAATDPPQSTSPGQRATEDDGMSEGMIATIVGVAAVVIIVITAVVCYFVQRKDDAADGPTSKAAGASAKPSQVRRGRLHGGSPVTNNEPRDSTAVPIPESARSADRPPQAPNAEHRAKHTSNPNAHDAGEASPVRVVHGPTQPRAAGVPRNGHARVSTAELATGLSPDGPSPAPPPRELLSDLSPDDAPNPDDLRSSDQPSREVTSPWVNATASRPGRLVKQGSAIPHSEFSDGGSDADDLAGSGQAVNEFDHSPSGAVTTAAVPGPRDIATPEV